jgi:acylphosphatase
MNLRGGARNLDDGRVEVIASGAVHALDRLEAALGEGPSLSRVSRVDVEALAVPVSPADLAAHDVEF